jgi:hypothetical protein
LAIPKELLKATEDRAAGVVPYGRPGTKKTLGFHTCIPPGLLLDFEGGTAPLSPWVHRKRTSRGTWTTITQEEREYFFSLIRKEVLASMTQIKPAPLLDIISFDNTTVQAYEDFIEIVGNFDYTYYNSLGLDSLHEYSGQTQTRAKGPGNELRTMNDVSWSWVRAQEIATTYLRKLRNYRDYGVLLYMTGAEGVSKDYVNNPMSKAKGEAPPEPYSVMGTVELPGRLAEALVHIPDILVHTRLLNGQVVWVTEPEALPGGGAYWDAKDRWGRLDRFELPSLRSIMKKLYGEQTYGEIYGYGQEMVRKLNA